MTTRLPLVLALALGVVAMSSAAPVPKVVVEPEPTKEEIQAVVKQFRGMHGFNYHVSGGYMDRVHHRFIVNAHPRDEDLQNMPEPFNYGIERLEKARPDLAVGTEGS